MVTKRVGERSLADVDPVLLAAGISDAAPILELLNESKQAGADRAGFIASLWALTKGGDAVETKTLRAEVKTLDTEHPWGEFLVCLSAPTVDRDGEVVQARAFEPLPDHVTFDIDHGLKTSAVVGSGRPFYDGDRLMVRGTFSSIPRAQEVRTLVNEGHIRTTSVAFHKAQKETKDGITYINKAALLNGSFVPVPANTDATVIMSKSAEWEAAAARGLLTPEEARAVELKAAIGVHHTATTDVAWDNNANKTNLSNDAGVATYRKAFAWVDDGANPDLKGSYRFIHHMVASDGTVGAANLTACSTGIGVLNGGRGGTVIPDSGRSGVHAHLAAHLSDADREPPPLKSVAEAETKQGARNSAADQTMIQKIHDMAGALGAACQAEKSVSATDLDVTGAGGDDDGHLELHARMLRLLYTHHVDPKEG